MIDPALLLALKTKNEIRIAALLATSDEPMRLKDITGFLKTNRKCCSDALKSLIDKKFVTEFIKFGVTLYKISEGVQNGTSEFQNGPPATPQRCFACFVILHGLFGSRSYCPSLFPFVDAKKPPLHYSLSVNFGCARTGFLLFRTLPKLTWDIILDLFGN